MDKFNYQIEKFIEKGYSLDRSITLTLYYFEFISNYNVSLNN